MIRCGTAACAWIVRPTRSHGPTRSGGIAATGTDAGHGVVELAVAGMEPGVRRVIDIQQDRVVPLTGSAPTDMLEEIAREIARLPEAEAFVVRVGE